MDFISHLLVREEIAAVSLGISSILSILAPGAICEFGTEEQKSKYLAPLVKGEKVGFFATTEPNASSDPMSIETKAVAEADDYVINGQKTLITNGHRGDFGTILAKTETGKLSMFVVESATPGFSAGKPEDLMGVKGQQVSDLFLDNVRVPGKNLLGQKDKGVKVALTSLDGGRLSIAAAALGVARAAMEESVKYARDREQFGRKIATFQALQFYMADMATAINAARWLTYHAGFLKQRGQPHTTEAAMAKCFASEATVDITRKALQIYGGHGYTKRHKVERLYRDAKILEIYEGTSEIQRMIIARNVVGRDYILF